MDKKNKQEIYELIIAFIKSSSHQKKVTIYSEVVNFLKWKFDYMDWVGFYDKDEEKDELYLSIYVGDDACEIIPITKGVCGKCYSENKTQIVDDVHSLPYHIACSSSTNSEIVVPIRKDNNVISVLDIDSDSYRSFDEIDKKYLEEIAELLGGY